MNKRLDFKGQILELNIRRIKIIAILELLRLRVEPLANFKKIIIKTIVISITRVIELKNFD